MENVKLLRSRTGASLTDCLAALKLHPNLDQAYDYLKAKNLVVISSPASSSHGKIFLQRQDKQVVMVKVEHSDWTEDQFNHAGQLGLAHELSMDLDQERAFFKMPEREFIKATARKDGSNFKYGSYLHSNNQLGVIVELEVNDHKKTDMPEIEELAGNLAMQIAGAKPLCVKFSDMEVDVLTRQTAIFGQQVAELKKPEAAAAKILEGKVQKWRKDVVLIEQEALWQAKRTVQECVEEVGKLLGVGLWVRGFVRWEVA